MSILNRASDGLPSVLNVLRRTLKVTGPLSEDELLQLCAPSSVVSGGKPEMAKKTLNRWTQLKMFEEHGDRIHLAEGIAAIDVDDLEAFQDAALRIVLAPTNCPTLTERGEDNQEPLASDLVRAAAWSLAQDPYRTTTDWDAVSALQVSQRVNPLAFQNDTRWDGFGDWAPFLGLAENIAGSLTFNPQRAVRGAFRVVFAEAQSLGAAQFFARLAEALPILDGGALRAEVERITERPWKKVSAGEVSPALSLALLTLEAASDIRMEDRADAASVKLTGREGRTTRKVSHITRGTSA